LSRDRYARRTIDQASPVVDASVPGSKRKRTIAVRFALTIALLAADGTPRALGQGPPAPVLVGPAAFAPQVPPQRPPTRVGLPVPQINAAGELLVQPNVSAGGLATFPSGGYLHGSNAWPVRAAALEAPESLPPPALESGTGGMLDLPGGILNGDPTDLLWVNSEPLIPWDEFQRWRERPISPTGEPGLGRERVMSAPFEIDISQPFGNISLRSDAVYNLTQPNRAEYFWAKPGRGPKLPEQSVSYQDFRIRLEMGSEAFSLATEYPIRLLNPEVNDNTGGFGDMHLVQKTRMMDGNRWQITQLLRTVLNNGSARKGLGTGHVSMEPGVLARYKYSDLTYWHGQLKLMFPIAGNPNHSGPALTWGLGLSHVYYETDTFAYIPTIEFINTWILDGQVTNFPPGIPVDVAGDGIFNLSPGLRIVTDGGGDLGLIEFGINTVVSIGSDGWYDALLRAELRFVF
jgi:hypothetical protein